MRPEVIVLDVNETLSDLEPLRDRLQECGLPPAALDTWFAATLRDGFALCAAGAYASFRSVAAAVLRTMLATAGVAAGTAADERVEQVLEGFANLSAHPDVPGGLRRIHDAGVRLVTLTNGATAMSDRLLFEAGIDSLIEHRLSVDEPRRWKPHVDAYLYAARVCGVEPSRMAMAAVHPWDVDGAQRAGLSGVWINRLGLPYPEPFATPHLEVGDFRALANRLIEP